MVRAFFFASVLFPRDPETNWYKIANKKGPALRFKIGDGSVIKGWDIAVAGMTVGGERRAVIPANLAYGSKKMPDIPANSELTFDLKLLEIM